MTTMVINRSRASEAASKLIEQFRGQTNIGALVAAIAAQNQALEEAAFQVLEETSVATAVGEQLDGLGQIVGVERAGRNDTDYRARLVAQIAKNNSSGTIEELISLATSLGATTVELSENPPAKFDVNIGGTLANGADVAQLLGLARPAAVGYTFTWYEVAGFFRFDTAGQGFDQGQLGEMVAI